MPHANSSQISEDKYKIHPMNAGLKIRHCSPKAKNQESREEMGTKKHRKEWSLRGQDFDCDPNLLHMRVTIVCSIGLEKPDQCRPSLDLYKHNVARWQEHIFKAKWTVCSAKLWSFKLNKCENQKSWRESWKLDSISKFVQNDY